MTARWKKRLKQLWARRPHLGRGVRTAINLVIIAVILLYIWGMAGYPLFSPTLEYRRLERQWLLPKGEIVFSTNAHILGNDRGTAEVELNGENFTFMYGSWRVGAGENWTMVAVLESHQKGVYIYPRGDGPDPVPMPAGHLLAYRLNGDQGHFVNYIPLLFLDVPQGSARTEVEMDIPYRGKTYHRAGEGASQGNGVWLFGLETPEEGAWSIDWYEGASYTLRAYAQDGSLLGLWTGTVPKAGLQTK